MKKIILSLMMMTSPAMATTNIVVDKSTQTMHVTSDEGSYSWPVSTARRGYTTPSGHYYPQSLQTMHYSRKYHNAPMAHSIFFSGGYAIHATPHVGNLGRPASHGCIRLHPSNAARLFEIVSHDRSGTSITVR